MVKMNRSILVSAAGTGTVFGLLTRLRAVWGTGCKVVTTDVNPEFLVTASILSDKFIQSPAVKDPEYHSFLSKIIAEENIRTYIPILNEEFAVATDISRYFPEVDVWTNDLAAKLANNKRLAMDWLSEKGISVPKQFINHDIDPVTEYFVKPVDGYGSRAARVMQGREILFLPEAALCDLIIQEKCEFPEVTVDSFYDSAKGFCCAVARERLETKAGVCTKARVYVDEKITDIARNLAIAINQNGLICFQMMKKNNEWKITDLNFRPGAGTAMSVATGYDLVAAAFACRWGEDYQPFLLGKLDKNGVYVTRQYAEFVMS